MSVPQARSTSHCREARLTDHPTLKLAWAGKPGRKGQRTADPTQRSTVDRGRGSAGRAVEHAPLATLLVASSSDKKQRGRQAGGEG